MENNSRLGNLFVISGPSGAGKGTLLSKVIERIPDAWVSVSATTRNPRPGEEEGVHYYFLDKDHFLELVNHDGFLEWAKVHDNYYGTLKKSVLEHMKAGEQVILEIDVQGALQIRNVIPEAHLVFIEPPSLEELERRLRSRGTESDDVISSRMKTAEVELAQKMEYDIQVVNDDLEQAVNELTAVINSFANDTKGI
ncbi:MAG: guanylate kinase [Eggerthellaceae bacterium]|nr:guanylate kinase [Eggerthellaceae bacterium]